jgi:DeoR family suf operon transcriptional repressor
LTIPTKLLMIAAMRATEVSTTTPEATTYGSGLRGRILLELKRARGSTAKGLASRLRVSLNAVRHHLRDLQSQGLVEYERRNQGVGAPAFAYRLTSSANLLFPRHYEATVSELLDYVVGREGRAAAVAVLEARYEKLTRNLLTRLDGQTPADRVTAVARLLNDEGYMAEATTTPTEVVLVEHNCAIQAVAERFPEICAAEAKFLASVLGAEVDRRTHILSGCNACEYRVRFPASGQPALPTAGERQ